MTTSQAITGSTAQAIDTRRDFLATSVTGLLLIGCAAESGKAARTAGAANEKKEAEVTPGEDLMQEHGLIERILLIYDEGARRITQNEPLDLETIAGAARIVRRFVEDYHEKQEEQFVFPRLQRAGREEALVAILLRQHQRGRELTEEIVRRASSSASPELAQSLRSFSRMYRPHAAREDTVLFPAFRAVVGADGYQELGERFEENEHTIFGEHGFENTVAQVAQLESALGIDDLAQFTAR
ncbi:MAG TPA: hemerythrin domain-containing protein [Polyangiaceae bacterium]|nr:hemerythrin domain-containing protein [Polyangiaceae bacterium]